MITLHITIAILAILAIWIIAVFNSMVRGQHRVKEAWSDINVQLKRRHDLIPNLIEIVKGYASHERELFEKVTEARTKAMGAKTIKEHGEAENLLSSTLKSLFAVSENYPDLKANQNFLELQREFTDTENKIQAARRFYNSNVRDFNIKITIFPNFILAKLMNFQPAEFFEIEEADRKPVSVKF